MPLLDCIVQGCISMFSFAVDVSSMTQYQLNFINVTACCGNVDWSIPE